MGAVTNNDRFTSVTTNDSSPDHIKDGVDFPHTGLLKALSLGMKGNYAISGFNITATTATSLTVADGVVMRVGKKVDITGATLTLSTAYTNGYHLLVAPTGGTVELRNPTAQDEVADYNDGDVIIAVVTHTGNNPMQIQFLTSKQTENSLTIGRNSSGYTESLTIQSNAGDVEIKATEQDKDIIFNVNDGGTDTEVMRLDASTSRVGIGTASPTCELEIRGSDDDAVDLKVSRNSTQFTGIRNSDATGAILQNHSPESNKKTLYFDNVHDSSGSAAGTNNFVFRAGASSAPTEILRIEDTGNLKMANGKTIRSPQLQTLSKSANYTLDENDAGKYIIVTASATITLPPSSNAGQHYTILNTHSSDITVARNGNDINGSSADITVGTFGGVTCIGIGSNDWIALGV